MHRPRSVDRGVLVLTPEAQAAKLRPHHFAGKTTQNRGISFLMVGKDTQLSMAEFTVETTLTCEDASHEGFGLSFGFGSPGHRLKDGVLNFNFNDTDIAVHLHGHFGTKRGAGTIEITEAELTKSEDAQTCTTGVLRFRVSREPRERPAAGSSGRTPSGPSRSRSAAGASERVSSDGYAPSDCADRPATIPASSRTVERDMCTAFAEGDAPGACRGSRTCSAPAVR